MTNQLSKADIAFLGRFLSEGSFYQPHRHELPLVKRLAAHGLAETGKATSCYRRTELGSAFLAALTGDSNV